MDAEPQDALDARITKIKASAHLLPWFVLRDSDRDEHDCPRALVESLRGSDPHPRGLCLRLAVRALDAWLLADHEAFGESFGVRPNQIPREPEDLVRPKRSLVDVCRTSRRRSVVLGLVPRPGSRNEVGPEYGQFIVDFCLTGWRPDVAARRAPSLLRALNDLDRWRQSVPFLQDPT